MNKNVIKITESELKRIVNESVQNILSELDWKTYKNAADARHKQYDDAVNANNMADATKFKDKRDNLQNAAMNALDRQYATIKDKAQAIQDRWDGKHTYYKGEGWLRDESSHDNFTQSIYNIQGVINNAMKKAERGLWHDEELSRLNAFCQDYIDTYKELLSKMK